MTGRQGGTMTDARGAADTKATAGAAADATAEVLR